MGQVTWTSPMNVRGAREFAIAHDVGSCAICPRAPCRVRRLAILLTCGLSTCGLLTCGLDMTTVADNVTNAKYRYRRAMRRRAMTLLELMLVLALLVVIGAMAVPAFQVPFEYHRLRQGGELVRVEWNKARIKAMKTGQIQMFRYTAQTGTYQVMPYFTQQDSLEADAAHSIGMGMTGANQQMATATQAADEASSVARELPEGVVFVQSEVETDTRSIAIEQQLQSGRIAGALESSPVLFYPDGTTSDARIVLTNPYQRLFVVISLRSLTGIAKVSGLLTTDELQQFP
jgi:Tfp pilus assembly protein FimT